LGTIVIRIHVRLRHRHLIHLSRIQLTLSICLLFDVGFRDIGSPPSEMEGRGMAESEKKILTVSAYTNGAGFVFLHRRLNQLVRLDTETMRFPQSCPVCGAACTATGFVMAESPEILKATRNYWRGRKSTQGVRGVRRGLIIPVCDAHAEDEAQRARVKVADTLLFAVSIILLVFSGANIGFAILDHQSPALLAVLVFALSVLLTALALRGLGPSKLERVVNIVDLGPLDGKTVLRIRNCSYLEELIRLNPGAMRAVSARGVQTDGGSVR
jgi:hypothetical protein